MKTKTKIIVSCVLFAASFVLEGIAGKLLPFDDIVKSILPKKA